MARINVSQLREDLGLSRRHLADKMGVHVRTIQRWELAEADPSPMAVHRLKEIRREKDAPTTGPVRHVYEPPDDDESASGPVPSIRR